MSRAVDLQLHPHEQVVSTRKDLCVASRVREQLERILERQRLVDLKFRQGQCHFPLVDKRLTQLETKILHQNQYWVSSGPAAGRETEMAAFLGKERPVAETISAGTRYEACAEINRLKIG